MIRYVLAKRGEGGHFSISLGRASGSLAQLVESVRDETHVSRVPSPCSRFDEMRDVFGQTGHAEQVEAAKKFIRFGCVRQLRSNRRQMRLDLGLGQSDLRIPQQTHQIIFGRRHEGPLKIDEHKPEIRGLSIIGDRMDVGRLEVSMGETSRGRLIDGLNQGKCGTGGRHFLLACGPSPCPGGRPFEPLARLGVEQRFIELARKGGDWGAVEGCDSLQAWNELSGGPVEIVSR